MREYLKKMREEKGRTLQDVADKIGITKQYYQMIESGERQRKMDITLIKSISSVFGIPLEQVVNEESKLTEAQT